MIGANAKWISQRLSGGDVDIYNYGSWGYGFDAGALVRLPDFNALFGLENFGSLSVGITLQDISKTTLTWEYLGCPKRIHSCELECGRGVYKQPHFQQRADPFLSVAATLWRSDASRHRVSY